MKRLFILPLLLLAVNLFAQNIEGAWKLTAQNGATVEDKEYIKIYQDGYFAYGGKQIEGNKFIEAGGGAYNLDGKQYSEVLDFFSSDPKAVGKTLSYTVDVKGDKMTITSTVDDRKEVWKRISDKSDDLAHNWVITGRANDQGEVGKITPGDRRTVKILGGGRFQWIAFNSKTGEFSGTGGGSYTASNGKYTEHITFFSRDNSRVGADLEFDYKIKDGEWHHSGKSSTGNPIFEIWSKYKEAYKGK